MKKFLLVFFLLFLPAKVDAQVVVQTWIDPCTGTAQTATFPIGNIGVTIVFRNQSKIFTAQQAASGELMAWINQLVMNTPCTVTNNPVVQQAATQAATAAASAASHRGRVAAAAAASP